MSIAKRISIPAGNYFFRITPVTYTPLDGNGWPPDRQFRFKIHPNNGVTNYVTDDYFQRYTTVQSYSITGSGISYTAKLTHVQEQQSVLTSERYLANIGSMSTTGTKEQCESWLNTYLSKGYQRWGSNPKIVVYR